jgi:hypothetical protein
MESLTPSREHPMRFLNPRPSNGVVDLRDRGCIPLAGHLRCERPMVVTDLLDLPVYDLHHFRSNRLDLPTLGACSREQRLGDSMAVVSGAQAQIAMSIGKHRELRLV